MLQSGSLPRAPTARGADGSIIKVTSIAMLESRGDLRRGRAQRGPITRSRKEIGAYHTVVPKLIDENEPTVDVYGYVSN